jgi:hypothetical protein
MPLINSASLLSASCTVGLKQRWELGLAAGCRVGDTHINLSGPMGGHEVALWLGWWATEEEKRDETTEGN